MVRRSGGTGRRIVLLGAGVGLLAGAGWVADGRPSGSQRHVFSEPYMGTEFRVVLHGTDSAQAGAAAGAAFARIAELERVLSDYDPESELSRLSATAGEGRWVPVSHDLWTVLSTARSWSERTGGAFDVTVGPWTRLWRSAARRGSVPSPEALENVRTAVGYDGMELDPELRAVHLRRSGARLDAGAIGKGYAADAALDRLRDLGFPAALVDAGGDIRVGEPPPGEAGWRIGLPGVGAEGDDSGCVVVLSRAAVATSGDGARPVEVGRVRHSHILDPRIGASLTHRRTVTVIAATATEADVLASALSVLGAAEGRALIGEVPGAAALVLAAGGEGWQPSSETSPIPAFPNCARP